jgi:hypothetical protein
MDCGLQSAGNGNAAAYWRRLDLSFNSPAEMIVNIGNSGNKVAGHVTATLEDSNKEPVAKKLRDLPITTGIGHLAPGGRLRFRIIVSPSELLPDDAPASVTVI